MPLSRSPQTDRRRRAIRESLAASIDYSDEARVSPSRSNRQSLDDLELPKKDRGVAYSHSVRRACQHRLVQLIPVRKLSLAGAVAASVAVPLLLVVLHYLVFVSHTLAWSSHPMSALLNAGSPRSIAAWLSSHLWLLCLAATVFTFRLRKHKLDDYEGEYRLWFWLVFTCLIGSIDSTTRLTDLFGAALDRWSQVHVGWTGPAIVQATLATLIGLLGLRLCTELKSVPTSLILWLTGLLCWAGSAALSQSLLRIDMSLPTRDWLRASLWLGGLTAIWLSGLIYLRAVFMDAQQRFLARTVLTARSGIAWRERFMHAMPKLPRFGRQPNNISDTEFETDAARQPRRKKRPDLPPLSPAPTDPSQSNQPALAVVGQTPAEQRTREPSVDREIDQEYGKRRGWFQRPEKPVASSKTARKPEPATSTADNSNEKTKTNRSWSQRLGLSRTKKAKDGQPKSDKRSWLRPKLPKLSLPKPKLPKLRLPSFRLPPPRGQSEIEPAQHASRVPGNGSRPVPSTSDPVKFKPIETESEALRGLSKAERKRLRRLQREDDGERRAA